MVVYNFDAYKTYYLILFNYFNLSDTCFKIIVLLGNKCNDSRQV